MHVASWTYTGRGDPTLRGAWLAWPMLQDAIQERRIAREKLSTVA